MPGITRNFQNGAKDCYYSANVGIRGGIRLLSKADRDLRVALGFRAVLASIQKRVAGCSCGSGELDGAAKSSFEDNFRAAVLGTLAEQRLDPQAMGLRFYVRVRSLWVPQPLSTPAYAIAELEAGLRAWRLLREARGLGTEGACGGSHWETLRQAYLGVMEEAGRCTARVAARLDRLRQVQLARQERRARVLERTRNAAESRRQARQERAQARAAERAERAIEQCLHSWARAEARRTGDGATAATTGPPRALERPP